MKNDSAKKDISDSQAALYGGLFDTHGVSVDAVASGKQIYKELRYEKTCKGFEQDDNFTLHDVGFGLGHFWEYVKNRYPDKNIEYSGSEVTEKFQHYCQEKYPESKFYLRDIAEGPAEDKYDYVVFGGTFNLIAGNSPEEFQEYVFSVLRNAFAMCKRGLIFNLITSYVEYRYDRLFYCDLGELINFVAKDLSRFFSLQHDYPLYEHTVCVYREAHIASQYPEEEFHKYYKNVPPLSAE